MILLGGECHSLTAILKKVTGRDVVHVIQKSYVIKKIFKRYKSYDRIVLLFDSEIGKGMDENTILQQLKMRLGKFAQKCNEYGIKIYTADKFCIVFIDPRVEEWFIRNKRKADIKIKSSRYRRFFQISDSDYLHKKLKKEKDSATFAELIVEISSKSEGDNAFKFLVNRLEELVAHPAGE